MTIYVDPETRVISVFQSDLSFISGDLYELDVDWFFLQLKDWEDGEVGMAMPDAQKHGPPVTLAGVTYAQTLEIINGYTVTFEDTGIPYTIRCTGANHNLAEVTNYVSNVSLIIGNSAGLIFSKEMEDQAYSGNRVWIDTTYGENGTQYPIGTPYRPTSTYDNATAIIVSRRFTHRFWLLNGSISLTDPMDNNRSDWVGSSPAISSLTFNGVNTTDYIIKRLTITGTMDGAVSMYDGIMDDIDDVLGNYENTGLSGDVTLPTGALTNPVNFINCFSIGQPVLDLNSSTNAFVQLRGYSGDLVIKNCSSSNNNISIDLVSGHVTLDSTVSAGTIIVRGTGYLTDNSTGTTVVITNGLSPVWTESEKDATLIALTSIANTIALLQKYEENRTVIDKTAKTLTVYDDDDITPILVFSLLDSNSVPSVVEVAERVPI